MADLNLYIDTQNRRLVESFTSRNTFTLPKFYAGDSGIVTRLHVLEPSTTSEIDRPYAYIDPTGFSYSLALGLLDQAPDGGTFTLTDNSALETTGAIAYNASASAVQTAVRAGMPTRFSTALVTGNDGGPWTLDTNTTSLGTPNVTGTGAGLTPESFVGMVTLREETSLVSARFQIRLLQQPAAFVEPATAFPSAAVSVSVIQAGGSGANEIQRVTINADSYNGTWGITATTLGETHNVTVSSGPIPYNATAAAAQTIINDAFGTGNEVTVVLSSANTWDIEFTGENVADFNHATMFGDATGLIVPVGVSGTLSLNTGQMILLLGDDESIEVIFEIQQTDDGSGDTTTLDQETCTVYNDLINPETTGATELPSYLTPEDIEEIFDSAVLSVSTAGTSNISLTGATRMWTSDVTVGAGSGSYTRNLDLTNAQNKQGNMVAIVLHMPASTNPIIVIRDDDSSSVLYTETSTGSAYVRLLWFYWTGSTWASMQGAA
jgi:hypothetical protein